MTELAIFATCMACGFFVGLPYEAFSLLRRLFCRDGKGFWIGMALDTAYFLLVAVVVVYVAFALHFPRFRGYMWLGYALGGIIYLKSLHRMVAFFRNMCYNTVKKILKKAKKQEKTLYKEGELYDAR